MAITLIAHTFLGSPNSSPITTSGIDTTGANLIVVYLSSDAGNTTTVSDSKSNTYTALTVHGTTNPNNCRLYYCAGATVGTGHTFTLSTGSGFPSIFVQAFGGAGSFDSQNGASGASPGSVTPPGDGCVIVTGTGSQFQPSSIDSSFTISDT